MRQYMLEHAGITPHTDQKLYAAGSELKKAKAAMIMIHGRGASAESILELASFFPENDIVYIAPHAAHSIWYPFRFLEPIERNEPFLTSALRKIDDIIDFVMQNGISADKIMLLGFSQGACLALQYAATRKRKISALFGLSGGLIGSKLEIQNYGTELNGTSVFLGCSDVDFHIPKERVEETGAVFRALGADVTVRLYPNMPHTVNEDEIAFIKSVITEKLGAR